MSTKVLFLSHCGMTCMGGSENKKCKCTGPATCEMRNHPLYKYYRRLAEARMATWFQNEAKKKEA